jgi:riboflavin kinase/FMN adenylyltransferase
MIVQLHLDDSPTSGYFANIASEPLRAVLAMGVFDGLHQGHRYLLGKTIADAQSRGVEAWVVTFSCDPEELLKPPGKLAKLASNRVRLEQLQSSGVNGVLSISFNEAVASLEPHDFLDRIIASNFKPQAMHIGADFHFGSKALGGVADLVAWGKTQDCEINAHHLLCDSGKPITSTRIRGLLATGNVEEAALLLARDYSITATVVEGRHEGTQLGFPTANLALDDSLATVADGVYAGVALLEDGNCYPAAISVGAPSTFGDLPPTIEPTLLDYPADAPPLYGQTLLLSFHHYLRPMQAFASVDELKTAIANNVAQTRELFESGAMKPPQANSTTVVSKKERNK